MNNDPLGNRWYRSTFSADHDHHVSYRIRVKRNKVVISEYSFWNINLYDARSEAIEKYETLVRHSNRSGDLFENYENIELLFCSNKEELVLASSGFLNWDFGFEYYDHYGYDATRTRTMQILAFELEYYDLNKRPFVGLIEFLDWCFFDDEHGAYGNVHALPGSSRLYPFREMISKVTDMTFGNDNLPELLKKKPFK